MLSKLINFSRKTYEVAKVNIRKFVRGTMQHAETITIMGLASIGATSVISYMPVYYTAPIWVDVSMISPVIAVFVVLGLVKVAEVRQSHYASHTYYPI